MDFDGKFLNLLIVYVELMIFNVLVEIREIR